VAEKFIKQQGIENVTVYEELVQMLIQAKEKALAERQTTTQNSAR
jgi:hypothetical protein